MSRKLLKEQFETRWRTFYRLYNFTDTCRATPVHSEGSELFEYRQCYTAQLMAEIHKTTRHS